MVSCLCCFCAYGQAMKHAREHTVEKAAEHTVVRNLIKNKMKQSARVPFEGTPSHLKTFYQVPLLLIYNTSPQQQTEVQAFNTWAFARYSSKSQQLCLQEGKIFQTETCQFTQYFQGIYFFLTLSYWLQSLMTQVKLVNAFQFYLLCNFSFLLLKTK